MKISRAFRMLPLAGALTLAACDAGQPTDPFTDEAFLTQEDEIALDVLSDLGTVEAALALADVPVMVAQRHGMAHGAPSAAKGNLTQARLRFQEAYDALQQQDRVRAAERAREARRLVAGAALAAGGGRAIMAMVERAESLGDEVAADPACWNDANGLQGELNGLALQARERIHRGDSIAAGAHAIMAEQRFRQRYRDPGLRPGGAVVLVELGATAVSMATDLLDGVTDAEQLRFLDEAGEYQAAAEAALADGSTRDAVHLANLAIWTSLKAVVLPGGVTDEETAAMLALAETQYEAAAATEPEGVAATLLLRAQALLEAGKTMLETAAPRGVGALWRSAVISTWILG